MDYAQNQRNPRKHLVGIGAVVLVHGVVVVGLMNGMGAKTLEALKKPLEATLLEPPKLPPPPPPPPPPPEIKKVVIEQPKVDVPPPPFIPPPDVPAPVNPNAVVQETVAKPPPPTEQVIAAPVAPAPPRAGPKGVVKGASCSARAKPEYPRKALQEGVSALVIVHINMSKDGVPIGVDIKSNNVNNQALKREFASAATAAARQFRCESSEDGYILEQEFNFKVEE